MARILAVLCLGLALAACDIKVGDNGLSFDVAEGKASDEWTRRYSIQPGGRLDIVNTHGTIEAFPATGTEVEVTAARELRMRSPEEAKAVLKDIQMIEEAAADSVRIQSPVRQRDGDQGLQRGYLSVNYRIGLPPGLVVSLKTENGNVKVDNVKGQITATTTNGGVTMTGVSGPIEAQTVNGGVTLDLAALDGDVRAVGVNGGVRVNVPATIDANLQLRAVNGGVGVDGDLEKVLSVEVKERQQLRGRLNKGGRTIAAEIVNGGVRITADQR